MAALSSDVQAFIVTRLACYKSPTTLVKQVRAVFGVAVTRQQVQHYDPTVGKRPAPKWQALFAQTRAALQAGTADIAIAHQAYRLMELDELYREARRLGHFALAASLLEQAARETGGTYTNRRELSGPDGGPMAVAGQVVIYLPENGRGPGSLEAESRAAREAPKALANGAK